MHRPDFLRVFIPNGLMFDAIYNEYGEVAKIEGEKLEAKRNEISHPSRGIKNKYKLELFKSRFSDRDLKNLSMLLRI